MFGIEKPLPMPTEDTEAYWDACREGKLVTPLCQACQHRFLPPAKLCPRCLSAEVPFVPVSGKARVYSWIVVHKPQHPAFLDEAPYNVAIVELAEGPRMHTRLFGIDPAQVKVGLEVEVVFRKVDAEISLPYFRPVGSNSQP